MREWIAKNPDKKRESNRKDYAKSREAYIARAKKNKAANPAKAAASAHKRFVERFEETKVVRAERDRAWRANNPERVRELSEKRKGTREKHLPRGTIARLMVSQNGQCVYCKVDIISKYQIDHIMPIALGGTHTEDNVQLLCPCCNRRKSDKHPAVFAAQMPTLFG